MTMLFYPILIKHNYINPVFKKVAFDLTYDYKMVTAPIIRKLEESSGGEKNKPEEQVVSLTIPVQINFGEINQTLC